MESHPHEPHGPHGPELLWREGAEQTSEECLALRALARAVCMVDRLGSCFAELSCKPGCMNSDPELMLGWGGAHLSPTRVCSSPWIGIW